MRRSSPLILIAGDTARVLDRAYGARSSHQSSTNESRSGGSIVVCEDMFLDQLLGDDTFVWRRSGTVDWPAGGTGVSGTGVNWQFLIAAAAYNLVRMRRLEATA